MPNTSAVVRVSLEIDEKGVVRGFQNIGKESTDTGRKGKQAFKDMDKGAKDFEKSVTEAKATMAKMGAAVAALWAIKSGFDKLISSVEQYTALAGVQEDAEVRLAAVLKATGYAAGYTLDQLKAMASGFQEVTRVGDEVTLGAMAILASFKEVRGEAFERGTKAAMDMSTVMKQDLNSAILQIGKALNDPAVGLTALSKAGVTFTESQKETIKALQESGDMMAAQNIILKELESEYGGAATKSAKTFHGVLDQTKNALGDTKEEMGFLITKNQFFIEQVRLLKDVFVDWGNEIKNNREYLMQLAKDGFTSVLTGMSYLVDSGTLLSRTFELAGKSISVILLGLERAGWQLSNALVNGPIAGLQAIIALYNAIPTLPDIKLPDSLLNYGQSIKNSLDLSTKAVEAGVSDVWDLLNRPMPGNAIRDYVEQLEKVPAKVVDIAAEESKSHNARMGQLNSQAEGYQAMTDKQRKALDEFIDAHAKATTAEWEYQLEQLDKNYEKYDKITNDKLALEAWYSAELKKIQDARLKAADSALDDFFGDIDDSWKDLTETQKRELEKQARETEKATEKQQRAFESLFETIQSKVADIVSDWGNAWDTIKDIGKRAAAELVATFATQTIVMPVVLSVGSMMGLSWNGTSFSDIANVAGYGSSGGFSINDLFSLGKSGYSFLSDNSSLTSIFGGSSFTSSSVASNFVFDTASGTFIPAGDFSSAFTFDTTTGSFSSTSFADSFSFGSSSFDWAGLAGGAAFAVMASFVISKIMEGFTDNPDSEMVYKDLSDTVFYDNKASWSESESGLPFEVKGAAEAYGDDFQAALAAYFEAVWATVDGYTTDSIANIMAAAPEHLRLVVYGTEYASSEDALADLSNKVFSEYIGFILADLFPDAGTVEQEITRTLTEESWTGGREGDTWTTKEIVETYKAQVSAMYSTFNEEFFDAITPMVTDADGNEVAGNRWDAFVRFASVVQYSTTFLDDYTRQVEEFGESSVSAFENIEYIYAAMATVDATMESIVATSDYVSTLEEIDAVWQQLIATLEDAHATTEQLTQAEQGRYVALGAAISGLTSAGLESTILTASLQDSMDTVVSNMVASLIAETIGSKYLVGINEQIGKAWVDGGGDLEYVIETIRNIDTSEAQAEIDALMEKFGLLADETETVVDDVDDTAEAVVDLSDTLATAASNLETALQNEISSKQDELIVLQDNLDTARENYLNALDAEIERQEDARDAAQDAADTFRDLADALAVGKLDILSEYGGDPAVTFALAKELYDAAVVGVWNKDTDAMAALPDLAMAYIDAGKSVLNAVELNDLMAAVYSQMSTAESIAKVEAAAQEEVVDSAQDQIDALQETRDEVSGAADTLLSIDAAADDYYAASLALDESGLEQEISVLEAQLAQLQALNGNVISLAQARTDYNVAQVAVDEASGSYTFDEGIYLQNKLDQLNSNTDSADVQAANLKYGNTDGVWTMSELQAVFAMEGLTAEDHYRDYGYYEGVSPYVVQSVGYADGGIASGPASGYYELLHGTEAVIPLGKGNIPLIIQGGSDDYGQQLVAEVIEFRERVNDHLGSISGALERIEGRFDWWERKGIKLRNAS